MNNEETVSEFESKVAAYYTGELAAEEVDSFLKEVESNLKKSDYFFEAGLVWHAEKPVHLFQEDIDEAWEKQKALNGLKIKEDAENKQLRRWLGLATLAVAVACVIFGVFFLPWNSDIPNAWTSIESGNKTVVHTFPDGSTAKLSPFSTLRIPSEYAKSIRYTELSGKATFSITKNDRAPFVVKAGGAYVHVVGTEFTITTGNKIKLDVHEGEVWFYDTTQALLTPEIYQSITAGKSISID